MRPGDMMAHMHSRRSLLGFIAVGLLAGLGCQPSPPVARPHDTLRPGDLPGDSKAGPFSPDELTSKDRCPAHLQEIEEAILLYVQRHKQLPGQLNELRSIGGGQVDFSCPDSGLLYVYMPNGLRKPGGTKRILVHDQIMNRDGTRWCIMASDGRPGAAQSMEVVQIPEPVFLSYQ